MEKQTINAFAQAENVKQRQLLAIDRCCSLYYTVMGSIYNTAQTVMVDAVTELKRHPHIYRQAVKQNIRLAMQAYDKWEKRMRDVLADRYQFWLDLSDAVDDEMRRHIQTLRLSFDAWLLKYNVKDHTLISHLMTALTLIRFARETFDMLFDKYREQTHVDMRPMFRGGDFREIEHYWERAVRPLLTTPPGQPDINFNESHDVELAFRIIARKLTDDGIFNRAGEQGLKLNPDLWHLLPKEDRLRLKRGIPLAG